MRAEPARGTPSTYLSLRGDFGLVRSETASKENQRNGLCTKLRPRDGFVPSSVILHTRDLDVSLKFAKPFPSTYVTGEMNMCV